MYSYEFSVKNDTAYFKGIDNKIVAIDKEDMVHVLSVNDHWNVKKSKVFIDSTLLRRKVELSEYLLLCNPSTLYHANGNHLDFRKKNLITRNPSSLRRYVRPWIQPSTVIPHFTTESLCQKWFVIKSFQQTLGFVGFFPLSNYQFKQLISSPMGQFEDFSTHYENDSSYHHVLLGNFPTDQQTMLNLNAFYSLLVEHLCLRNISIHHLIAPIHSNSNELLSFMAKKNKLNNCYLYQSGTFSILRF